MDQVHLKGPLCGCWYRTFSYANEQWLHQVDLKIHSQILSATARTTLTQTFINPTDKDLKEVYYTFPLYDGVSVVSFKCVIGDRTIQGLVNERAEAKAQYDEAVKKGKKAALMQQSMYASDTFTTSIGNIPANSKAVVKITYLGELQHDAETDGVRFTIPNNIAPRYSPDRLIPWTVDKSLAPLIETGKISITVDVAVDRGSTIRGLQSPSHPISISLGRTSVSADDAFEKHYASATLTMKEGNVLFENDFVLIVKATEQEIPAAFLETHPTIPGQRAVMATLVPKFNLPNNSSEIVFIIDRSGSMHDKIETLKSALLVFLKSLPVGAKFNICSFGSHHSFLWEKSKTYDDLSLKEAVKFVDTIRADMGGTNMYEPVVATIGNRFKDLDMEVLLLTDGQIWDQDSLFRLINDAVANNPIRFFSLGIGDAASHSLVQGIARAGGGFAQFVGNNEKLDKKVVRMLKGALMPHVKDYRAEIEYSDDADGFEIIEKVNELPDALPIPAPPERTGEKMEVDSEENNPSKPTISLFDPFFKETDIKSVDLSKAKEEDNLPIVPAPKIMQAPYKIPALYPFNRTTVYLLLSPKSSQKMPKSLIVKGTSKHGPLSLKIPIQDVGRGLSVHQLAARKIGQDIEEGRGWISHAKDKDGQVIADRYESKKEDIIKREAVRLGVRFQVVGKYCSFVAVESDSLANRPKDSEGQGESEMGKGVDSSDSEPLFDAFVCAPAATPWVMKTKQQMIQQSNASPFGLSGTKSLLSDSSTRDPYFIGSLYSLPPSPSAPKTHSFGDSRHSADSGARDRSGYAPPVTMTANYRTARSHGRGGSQSARRARVSHRTIEARTEPAHSSHGNNKIHDLISLQYFDGSWGWCDELFQLTRASVEAVEGLSWSSILGNNVRVDQSNGEQRCIIATLLAISYLHQNWSGEIDTWELVADKGIAFVKSGLAAIGGDSGRQQKQLLSFFNGLF